MGRNVLSAAIRTVLSCEVPAEIRTAALAHIRDRKLLQTRSVGEDRVLHGRRKDRSRREPEQALHREIREELDAGIVDGTLEHLGVFEAPAYGHPPEAPTCT